MPELFPETVVTNREPRHRKREKKQLEQINRHQKSDRLGVCKCGSGRFRLAIKDGIMTRICKGCGNKTEV